MILRRTPRFDELGLRRALTGPLVPFLVAAMGFLAALALAGWTGAASLSRQWERGAGATLTIQVPRPGEQAASGTRLAAVEALLGAAANVETTRTLPDEEVAALLRPWLGADISQFSIPVPAVIAVHLRGTAVDLPSLAARLAEAAPGTILEDHAAWAGRLASLARSLQLCAGLVLLLVALVTVAVIAVATRAALAARRDAVTILHQLGATDGYIARRFAGRAARLAAVGGALGGVFALPVLFLLAAIASPLIRGGAPADALALFPPVFWLVPVVLPAAAAMIGYVTAQAAMRRWLRRLP